MKRVLIDTDVVPDVVLDGKPHGEKSSEVWAAIEEGRAKRFLAAHAISTIHCLVCRELGMGKARQTVTGLLRLFDVAPVDAAVISDC